MPKSLIMYQTQSGNTEKVAFRFKEVFEKKGWKCDILKVDKNTDVDKPPDFDAYDFLCVGSGVNRCVPAKQLFDLIHSAAHPLDRDGKPMSLKIVPGPKKGVVFVTYAGIHLGPQEAEPALGLLALQMEHLKFICIGRFSCPGKFGDEETPKWWHGDIRDRPNERDLLKAEIFLEDKLEEILVRHSGQYQG